MATKLAFSILALRLRSFSQYSCEVYSFRFIYQKKIHSFRSFFKKCFQAWAPALLCALCDLGLKAVTGLYSRSEFSLCPPALKPYFKIFLKAAFTSALAHTHYVTCKLICALLENKLINSKSEPCFCLLTGRIIYMIGELQVSPVG